MMRAQTPSFLLELPLQVTPEASKHLRGHFEAARCLYNAILGEAMNRLRHMRADPAWQAARVIPQSQKQERQRAFSRLRDAYGFSEYALHRFAKDANCAWIADHIDALTAQALASRAYNAVNKVCIGESRKVRFKSKGRGLDSIEGKWNQSGIRFVLQRAEEGSKGWFVWGKDRIPAMIDWDDPVVKHGLDHTIKYVRVVRRKASSPQAQGADCQGYRYYAQLILEGKPHQKKKNKPGTDVVGIDLGPSVIALVPREGEARLEPLCAELKQDARKQRRLQRKLDRQRRANNPQNFDEKGRFKRGKQRLQWKDSNRYLITRRRLATQQRKLAGHRKSLHGRLVNDILRIGNHIRIEKLSYKGWQKGLFGKSVGLHAPGMLIDRLKTRLVASTGGSLIELSTSKTKLSQYCHGCHSTVKKPLRQRWHSCSRGIGPVQRDLYSAFLAAFLDSADQRPSSAQYSLYWECVEMRVEAALEVIQQRAKDGEKLPVCVGIPHVGARRPASLVDPHQELVYHNGRIEERCV